MPAKLSEEEILDLLPKKSLSPKQKVVSDAEIDKFVSEVNPEHYNYYKMSFWEKAKYRFMEGPFVFLGLGATTACLTLGIESFKKI